MDSDVDPFEDTFLRDHRKLSERFDVVLKYVTFYLLRKALQASIERSARSVDMRNAKERNSSLLDVLDFGSPFQHLTHALSKTLEKALGDRIKALTLILPLSTPRPISQGPASVPSCVLANATIGLTLDPEHAFRLVDHGPAATDADNVSPEAAEFRALWGEKAELRRFKDGRIVESVVWEVQTAEERARIPEQVVRHILALHFGIGREDASEVRGCQAELDALLRVPPPLVSHVVLPGAAPGYKNALTAFDSIVRLLRSLDSAPPKSTLPTLPLSILSVSPTSPPLRYTGTFTPLPLPLAHANSMSPRFRHLPSMDLVIQFERSGRWPDDLLAFQAMRLAFMEEIARCMLARTESTGLRARIVFPAGTPSQSGWNNMEEMARAYLEIVAPEGWAFAGRIWHDRELTLLERALGTKKSFFNALNASSSLVPASISKASLQTSLSFYKRTYIHGPRHHRAIASLVHRYGAFCGTVRLVQRWLASHWLFSECSPKSDGEGGDAGVHVRCEAVELIAAYVFIVLCGGGGNVPGTKELGFFRVVSFLASWEWERGLYVPLYEDNASRGDDTHSSTPSQSIEEGKAETEGKKSALVSLKAGSARSGGWTLATREDSEGKMWTESGPTALVARRVRTVASVTIKCVDVAEASRPGVASLNPKTLFVHPTDDYDVLIRLRPEALCRAHQSVLGAASGGETGLGRKYANIPRPGEEDSELRVDYDPASEFFRDLKVRFNSWPS